VLRVEYSIKEFLSSMSEHVALALMSFWIVRGSHISQHATRPQCFQERTLQRLLRNCFIHAYLS